MTKFDLQFLADHLWLIILTCLILLATSFYYYRRTIPPQTAFMRYLLSGLRVVAFIALFLALSQPTLTIKKITNQKKRAVFLVDASRSMQQPLSQGGATSRLDEADDLFNGGQMSALRDNLDIDRFSFAESLDVAESGPNLVGAKTDIGEAVEQLRQYSLVQPYDYIFVISDGRITDGASGADVGSRSDRPIYAIAVGDSIRTDDIVLSDVEYNDVLFAGKQTEIAVTISQQGNPGERLQLVLKEGNKIITQKAIAAPGDGRNSEEVINFTPARPGKMILDLEITGAADDHNEKNNRRKFAVRVLKSKLNILLYSSSVNQEYAFLNRFLKGRDDYEVTPVIDAAGGDRLGERFPGTQERLNSYDLLMLVDPNLDRLSAHQNIFNSYLSDRGGAILLLMGPKYAASAGNNPLEKLSPLAVGLRRGMVTGSFHIEPDARMIFHPAVKLADTREAIANVWANQPPFAQCLPPDSLRKGSTPLGYIQGGSLRQQACGLAFRRMGPGKVMASAVAPFWHWAFYPVGVGGNPSIYSQFFGASIRWLTISDESDRISFKPVAEVFQSGEPVGFTGTAHDEGFRPITGASGNLIVISDKNDTTSAMILPDPAREGGYKSDVGVLAPGNYRYQAVLASDNVTLGNFEGTFAVDEIDRETAFADVDWSALKAAADNSGGAFASYKDLKPITDNIDFSNTRVERSRDYRLWDHYILMIIIIVALSAEWIIRKQRQLL